MSYEIPRYFYHSKIPFNGIPILRSPILRFSTSTHSAKNPRHQHSPSSRCSQFPAPTSQSPSSFLHTPDPRSHLPAPHTQLTSKRLRGLGSRLPILEFLGLPAAQILHKIVISALLMRRFAYNKINNLRKE